VANAANLDNIDLFGGRAFGSAPFLRRRGALLFFENS